MRFVVIEGRACRPGKEPWTEIDRESNPKMYEAVDTALNGTHTQDLEKLTKVGLKAIAEFLVLDADQNGRADDATFYRIAFVFSKSYAHLTTKTVAEGVVVNGGK